MDFIASENCQSCYFLFMSKHYIDYLRSRTKFYKKIYQHKKYMKYIILCNGILYHTRRNNKMTPVAKEDVKNEFTNFHWKLFLPIWKASLRCAHKSLQIAIDERQPSLIFRVLRGPEWQERKTITEKGYQSQCQICICERPAYSIECHNTAMTIRQIVSGMSTTCKCKRISYTFWRDVCTVSNFWDKN
jgi:hypothetical protein